VVKGLDALVIGDAVLEGRRLSGSVTVPRRLRKYFRSLDFFAIYDEDINADASILNIPLLATVLPFAWLVGVDVYVSSLDKTFKASMDQLQHEFKKYYPLIPLTTHIYTDRLVENRGDVDAQWRHALLFSGGVDSTYTLLTHLDRKPRLIMFWGVDDYPYPENAAQWQAIIATYAQFAQRLGLPYHVIKTNNSVILDDRRISHDFHQSLYDGWFRLVLQHTFVLIPLTAPLSLERFDRLFISGGTPHQPEDRGLPHPSRPETDEKFVWADLTVTHVGDVYREEKIRGPIKEYAQQDVLPLKVCIRKLDRPQLNDSTCTKCLSTIASLTLTGIDPNQCGFQVDANTWIRFKEYLEHDLVHETFWAGQAFTHFLALQKSLPDDIDHDFYGSKALFAWFRDFDLTVKEKDVWFYRDLYHRLPYPLANILNKVYVLGGIRIHDNMPLPRARVR
jgi:hypothetical protein